MILGRLVGTIWATRKCERLENYKLAIIRPYFWYNPSHDVDHLVAVDQVGAEVGQDVIVCMGAPGRWQAGDFRVPVEASVMAIVDKTEIVSQVAGAGGPVFELRSDMTLSTLGAGPKEGQEVLP